MVIKKKVFGILGAFILIFVFFLILLLRPSLESKATAALSNSMNLEDVKSVWYKYKDDLFGNGANKSDIITSDFTQSVYAKIRELKPSITELDKAHDWLPVQENLNVIIVPDLSRRIVDTRNNPNQVSYDKELLMHIWDAFEQNTRLKMNSSDRFLVDVSDPNQAQGQFRELANRMVFDLSGHRNKSNRLYFANKREQFRQMVDSMYSLAVSQTTGADYTYYFGSALRRRIQENTVSERYRNIVLIPTDGYLEVSNPRPESITPNGRELSSYCNGVRGPIRLPTATMDEVFPNVEVYLLEVRERKGGEGCHSRGLKAWWKEWFKQMEIANANDNSFFIEHEDAMQLTKSKVEAILD